MNSTQNKKLEQVKSTSIKARRRLLYTLFTKDVSYDAEKMRMGIRRTPEYQMAA